MHEADPASNEGDLVALCEAPNEFAARSLVIVLAEAGIEAATFGAGELPHIAHLTTGKVRGVTVHVARRDEARAARLLEELPRRASEIDWDSIDVGESGDEPEPAAASGPPPSFLDRPGIPQVLLVLAGLGLTLAVVGFLIEWSRRR